MEDTLWSEIADAPGEIFDIPEMRELDEEYQNDEATWNAFLNSHWDFWWCSLLKNFKHSWILLSFMTIGMSAANDWA